MRPRSLAFLGLFVIVASLPATTFAASPQREKLEMYSIEGTAAAVGAATTRLGLELVNAEQVAGGTRAQAVLTRRQAAGLRAEGLKVRLVRNDKGQTVTEQARLQALNGFTVWRSWDEPGGFRDQLYQIAAENPGLTKLRVLGHTWQGREIIALKVTDGARGIPDGKRPAVLYSSLQHAREWISAEVNRRTLRWFIDQWRGKNKEVRDLLKTRELWFILVANPDGYQYTFDGDRLWRKNLRDNDHDGTITSADGVDPNRNFDEHWAYDDEGSSSDPTSETYRGPSPASEPETQAMQGLIDRVKPKFQSNLHSVGEWLLYPQGWQIGTLDADNPIYVAVAGTDAHPAIAGFNPGQSADTLYVTNGETTDYADVNAGTIAITPELGDGDSGGGFVFPDDEALVQAEFERVLPFQLGLARSATDPDDPVSPVGITVDPFYLNQTDNDPQNGADSLFDFTFSKSYGDLQEVRILAKRSLGAVQLKYSINGGAAVSKATSQWNGGDRYGPGNGKYFHVVSGLVTGTTPGDDVRVWFEGGGQVSDSFTYEVVSDTGNRTLVVAAEDYSGASPAKPGPPTAPEYLSFYTDALEANDIAFDVYDVDANGRTAPDNLGVLSHYDGVIWYTGDDVVTRERGWGVGNASRLAMQEILGLRDFLNEGGRALYTGQRAGQQFTSAVSGQIYDPFENRQCSSDPAVEARCLPLAGSGDGQGDVIEYWLGAGVTTAGGGIDPETGDAFDISGLSAPLDGLTFSRNGPDSADNQGIDASFISTEDYLAVTVPTISFPQFASEPSSEYLTGIAGPFEPHGGSKFMWSQLANEGYKRLTRTITVPAGGATLTFWTSYNVEFDFDYLIVEAHTVGLDDWTTLPDANGHTSDDLSFDQACINGWSNPNDPDNVLHPFLTHYQTFDDATGECSNTGSTGSWNAANGPSGGWQQFEIDLSGYAGSQVEVSITDLSDWGLQVFPGVFIDDIVVSTGEGSTSFEDDADPMDGWVVSGAPQDADGFEGPNANDWDRRGGFGIKEGASVTTPSSVYLGFGFEGISGAATRAEVIDRIVDYLLN